MTYEDMCRELKSRERAYEAAIDAFGINSQTAGRALERLESWEDLMANEYSDD
jgi:hypothetical protein